MAKPEFDPSQPFEAGKPEFDESKPFTAGDGSGQMGVPASDGLVASAVHGGAKILAGLGKLADIPSVALVRGPLSAIHQIMGGKPTMSNDEFWQAMNPLDPRRAPDLSEMAARAGIKNPQLSDVMPGYGPPNSGHFFGMPEKGGKLDPSAAGVTQFLSDPLNVLSMGSHAAEKAALDASAVRQAIHGAPGPVAQATNAISMPAQAAAAALPTAARAATAPSDLLGALGRRLYRSTVGPVEYQGQKFGKQDVAGTFYDVGIKTPYGLEGKAEKATGTLMNARDKILDQAKANGGSVNMDEAMAPLQARLDQIRASRDQNLQPAADVFQSKIDNYKKLETGTPGTPPSVQEVTSPLVDANGRAIVSSQVIPGTPGTPGRPVTPPEGSGYKSSTYNGMPSTAYNDAIKTPAGAQLQKLEAYGLKRATEKSVGDVVGPRAQQSVTDLNDASGKMLSTKGGQRLAEKQADRHLDRTFSLDNTSRVLSSVAEGAHAGGGWKAFVMNKLLSAAQMGTMPTGYALQKLAENPATATFFDDFARRQFKNIADSQAQGGPRQSLSPYQPQEN